MFGDDDEKSDDASEFEREQHQTPGALDPNNEELTDDEFDHDALAEMFANLKNPEGDDVDW